MSTYGSGKVHKSGRSKWGEEEGCHCWSCSCEYGVANRWPTDSESILNTISDENDHLRLFAMRAMPGKATLRPPSAHACVSLLEVSLLSSSLFSDCPSAEVEPFTEAQDEEKFVAVNENVTYEPDHFVRRR